MLATFLIVVCMTAGNDQCVTINPLHEQVEAMECLIHGQRFIRQWMQEAGPGYELRFENADHFGWKCQVGSPGNVT